MNRKALQKLSYGVYLVTTANGDKLSGCVANSAMQITSTPAALAVSLNHDNETHDAILKSGSFVLSVLPTDTAPSLIGGFGYRSGKDTDKFQDIAYTMEAGLPVPEAAMAWIRCKVLETMDAGTHTLFLAQVEDGDVLREEAFPMTYQYYHTVIKGKSPKNAPTYGGLAAEPDTPI